MKLHFFNKAKILFLLANFFFMNTFPAHLANVKYNDVGIPIINGDSLEDIFFTVGYLMAKNRLYQIVLNTEIANGRLSGLIGPDGVSSDILQLQTSYTDAELEAQFNGLAKCTKVVYNSWIDGIRKRIKEVNSNPDKLLPYELKALGVETLLVYDRNDLLRTSFYTFNGFSGGTFPLCQLQNADLIERLFTAYPTTATAMFSDFIMPATFKTNNTVVPNNVCQNSTGLSNNSQVDKNSFLSHFGPIDNADLSKKAGACRELFNLYLKAKKVVIELGGLPRLGSYGGVISKEKSKTGNPLLFSGTQPLFNFPDFYYQYNIDSPKVGIEAHIFSTPLTPVTLIGAAGNHAITIQTGHLPTQSILMEPFPAVPDHEATLVIKTGSVPLIVTFPVFRSPNKGWVIYNPETVPPFPTIATTLQDVFIGDQLKALNQGIKLLFTKSLKETIKVVTDPNTNSDLNSFHMQYIDTKGDVAAFHLGGWIDFPAISVDQRLPFGFPGNPFPGVAALESAVKYTQVDTNTKQGFYAGWNTQYKEGLPFGRVQGVFQFFAGELEHVYWIDNFIKGKKKLGIKDLENLMFHVGKANGSAGQGLIEIDQLPDFSPDTPTFTADAFNPLYRKAFFTAVESNPTPDRLQAVKFLESYNGNWILGDRKEALATKDISNQWILAQIWETFAWHNIFGTPWSLNGLVFPDFVPTASQLFITDLSSAGANYIVPQLLSEFLLLGRILDSTNCNNPVFFDWLNGRDLNQLIVQSLDEALAVLGGIGNRNNFGKGLRPTMHFRDPYLGFPTTPNSTIVHEQPMFNLSGNLFVAEGDKCRITNMRGVTPQGQDGMLRGTPPAPPKFGKHAFDQSNCYQHFKPKPLPPFKKKCCKRK